MLLLKEGTSRAAALRDRDDVDGFVVPPVDEEQPSLFVVARDARPPWWAGFLDPHIADGDLHDLFNASSSAALLVGAEGRLFALTFGYGRHLLEPEVLEQDFGLKVVLNTVEPTQLKSVDARTIDELTVHTRRDVSRDSSFSAFELDPTRDLLRAVTGTPLDEALARRLSGSDSVSLNTRAQVPELRELCARLLRAYEAKDYQAHFDFIDYLRPERDAARVRDLEQELVAALRSRAIDDVHLAAPEVIDWLDIDGFRFSTQPADCELDADPRVSSYLDSVDGEVTFDMLKRDLVLPVRSSDGHQIAGWPVLRCLVYEVQSGEHLHVLSAGEWYRVGLTFKDRVDEEVEQLPELTMVLPEADPGTDEDEYNLKAAASTGSLCLDKKLVYDGGPDKMEICDLLTRHGGLIHLKHRGSSSTLSHLFAQGVNSAERLLQDPEFRRQAREIVSREDPSFADVLPADRPVPEEHEITFAVITRSDRPTTLTLPFFSRVSLRTAARRLHTLGFRVSVAAVREPTSTASRPE